MIICVIKPVSCAILVDLNLLLFHSVNSCCSTTYWFNGVHVEKMGLGHSWVPFNKMPDFLGMSAISGQGLQL